MSVDRLPPRRVLVDVVICTIGRSDPLRMLLGAIDDQRFPDSNVDVCTVVVDNSRGTVDFGLDQPSLSGDGHTWIREERPGIPIARNTGLEAVRAEADFVVFIDDDELPGPTWLGDLLECQRRFQADVVTGPVVPRFMIRPPGWAVQGGFYERPRHPDGSLVSIAYTNNVLVRAQTLRRLGARPFQEELALTGGSDAELFGRIASAGAHMRWADRAVVEEWVPPERLRVLWLMRRSYRIGNNSADFARLRGLTWREQGKLARRSARRAVIGVGGLLIGLNRGKVEAIKRLRQIAYGLGGLMGLLGHRYEEYRDVRP